MNHPFLNGAPLNDDQIRRYLNRLELEPPAALDLAYLTRLQKAHISHIPFENLDIMAGIPLSLDRDHLFHKVIECRRGGVCSELNTLYNWLLESLGFQTVSYSSRIIAKTAPVQAKSHRVLGVTLKDGLYLTDVGFNFEHHRIPLLLKEELVQDDGECQYRLTRDPIWGWVLWQNRPQHGWRKKISFTQEPHIDLDFVAPTFFAEAHPDSKINQYTKVSLHIDGVFHAIRSGHLLVERGGVEEILKPITAPEQEEKILEEVFGLRMPDR